MKNLFNKILITFVFGFLIANSCFALVTNINSGAAHSAIQDAVVAANSGDTLLVSTGQYNYMWLSGKSLTILGGYTADFSAQVSYTNTILSGSSYCASFPVSTSTVEGLTFSNSKRGITVRHGSLVTARHCRVENNLSANNGAGIVVFENSTLVLEDCVVENNSVTNIPGSGLGGGAYIYNSSSLIASNSVFRYNFANYEGGGIAIGFQSYVELKGGSLVYANISDGNGGGIYSGGGKLFVHDGSQIGGETSPPNIAKDSGGGIYAVTSSVVLKGPGPILFNNYAGTNGGGAYIYNTDLSVYDNAEIGFDSNNKTNFAGDSGGGIYALNSVVAITNSEIYACWANDDGGGGIYAREDSDVILFNSVVGNTNDTYLNFSENRGGGVSIEWNSSLVANGTTFINNHAKYDGGGISCDDSNLIITNSVFKNNIGNNDGGAIFLRSGDAVAEIVDSLIVSNYAEEGGGILWNSNSNLVVRNSIILGNEATKDGAGVLFSGSGFANLYNVDIAQNTAVRDGGGFMAGEGQNLMFSNCIIRLNNGKNGGGGFILDANVKCIDSSLIENSAELDGGGVLIDDFEAVLSLKNVNVISNLAKSINGVVNIGGGGIAAASDSVLNLINCLFEYNVSSNFGGAIGIYDSTLNIESDFNSFLPFTQPPNRFFNNSAPNNRQGGAILITAKSNVSIKDAIFTNNFAGGYGGAVYVYDGSTSDFVNVILAHNSSINSGDGIRAAQDSVLSMAYCTVADNDEDGVTTDSSALAMTNCIVWGHSSIQVDAGGNVQYCDIEGGYATGTGNIDANPDFVSSLYELSVFSPCINTGINVNVQYDCVGELRPQLGGYDLGAYEIVPEPFLFIYLLFAGGLLARKFISM